LIPRSDPVTGDAFTLGEGLSWLLQGIIRRWLFLAVFATATAAVWILGSPAALGWWNYSASFLAIVIESVVGIGFYNMARRDSRVLRELSRVADRLETLTEAVLDEQRRSEK